MEDQLQGFKAGFKQLLIISYDLCRNHAALLQTFRCDLLVCDEGHRLKNDAIKVRRRRVGVGRWGLGCGVCIVGCGC